MSAHSLFSQSEEFVGTDELLLERPDLRVIRNMIPEHSRILDLGCGAGRLLKSLKNDKHAFVTGVERDPDELFKCVACGVPVIQANFDTDLADFPDDVYDFVILSRTLQAVRRPDLLLKEMLRVARTGIVSFMNFGHINCRVPILFGNMPVNRNLPRPWYNTQTIHPGTVDDLRNLFKELNIKVLKEIPLSNEGDFMPWLCKLWPNLFASNCVFVIRKNEEAAVPEKENSGIVQK